MTSRQRVEAAVNFRKPDRIPIDLGGCRASGINAAIYTKLKERLGIHTPTKVQGTMEVAAEIEPEMLEALHIDVVPLDCPLVGWAEMKPEQGVRRRTFSGTDVHFSPTPRIAEEPDGSWVLLNAKGEAFARMPRGGYYFDFIRKTMGSGQINPEAFQPSRTVTDEELVAVHRRAQHLYDNTDKAILAWGASIGLMGLSSMMSDNLTEGSLDEWLCMLMVEKQAATDMMGRYVDAAIERTKLYHQALGDRCMIWGVASDDGGTQRSELIRPELFEEMIKPHYVRLCNWVHQHTTWKTFLHSCGSIYHYIGPWIDAGIDILNPVQISAANMEPDRLMRQFGGKIVFWGGGCETQHVLPLEKPDFIREHVRQNIRTFGSGEGGFVFTQVHNIQQNVPVENVHAMFQAAYEYGRLDG
jgi:uroporphyrinogen-III decarboxylase